MGLGRNVAIEEPRRSLFFSLVKVVVGFVLVVLVGVVALAVIGTAMNTSSSHSTPRQAKRPAVRVARPGETVHVGYWSYKVNRAFWTQYLPGQSLLEHADAQYLVIDLSVRNDDQTPSYLPPVQLVDEQGRVSEQSSAGTFQVGALDAFKKLNPDVESSGAVIFDVSPAHHYRLLFSGGYSSGSAHVLAELPIQTPPPENAKSPGAEAPGHTAD